MQKYGIFVVYDEKAKAYLTPFFLPETGEAVRAFGDCVNDPNHRWSKHPSDYTLFQAGAFFANSGKFEIDGALTMVCNGVQVKETKL